MMYFPEKAIAAAFLTLSSKCWVLSYSKAWYSTANYLENAAVIRDKKNIALTRHARFYPELARKENPQLQEVYPDFTNRFIIHENIKMPCLAYRRFACGEIRFHHEIPLKRWFDEHRQMSGEWVQVRLREARWSEKIIKLKALLNDHADIAMWNMMKTSILYFIMLIFLAAQMK